MSINFLYKILIQIETVNGASISSLFAIFYDSNTKGTNFH